MSEEITITTGDDEADQVEAATDVVEVAQAAEAAGMEQGMVLGALTATVEQMATTLAGIGAKIEALEAAAIVTAAEVQELAEDVAEAEAEESVDEIVEAIEEAAEEEALDELAEEVADESDNMPVEVEEEVTPLSKRTHWYFRKGNEWKVD